MPPSQWALLKIRALRYNTEDEKNKKNQGSQNGEAKKKSTGDKEIKYTQEIF